MGVVAFVEADDDPVGAVVVLGVGSWLWGRPCEACTCEVCACVVCWAVAVVEVLASVTPEDGFSAPARGASARTAGWLTAFAPSTGVFAVLGDDGDSTFAGVEPGFSIGAEVFCAVGDAGGGVVDDAGDVDVGAADVGFGAGVADAAEVVLCGGACVVEGVPVLLGVVDAVEAAVDAAVDVAAEDTAVDVGTLVVEVTDG